MSSTTRPRRKRAEPPLRRVATAGLGLFAILVALVAGWLLYAGMRVQFTETLERRVAAPPGGRWVRAHDTEVHLREWGAPDAPPLLLVHGTGAWSGTWASNVDALQAAGFRVVAMDLPPFGFSVPPANRDYSRHAQARRILAVAQQLGPRPVTLLGHSFGGGPATEAALLDPQRIAHLVLVDAAVGVREEVVACTPGGPAGALLAWPGLRTLLVAGAGTEPGLSRYWLEQFVARKEVVTVERTAIYQKPFASRGFSEGLGDWAYQFATDCEQPASTQPASLRKLRVPVSLVWGDLDTITPLAQGQRLQQLVPNARLTVLRGVGHIPQIEDVAGFNFALGNVLRAPPAAPVAR